MEQLFADRFEQDAEYLVFRTNPRAAGVRVSLAERDGFVADFRRRFRIAAVGMIALALVVFASAEGVVAAKWMARFELTTELRAAIWICVGFFLLYWLWRAPDRALIGRGRVTRERSIAEGRHLENKRMSWRQLAGGLPALAVVIFHLSRERDPFGGWNRVWLALIGVLVVAVAIMAVRKLWSRRGGGG